MGAVGSLVKGATSFVPGVGAALGVAGAVGDLIGGGGSKSSGNQTGSFSNQQDSRRYLGGATAQEQALLNQQYGQFGQMGQQLGDQYGQAAQDYQQTAAMFRDALTKFATGSLEPSPEQLAQATSFVDQTFTAPAQQQYTKFLEQANTMSSAKAAAQGRSGLDSAIQDRFISQAGDAAQSLANQRGNLIAQRADELSYNRPQAQLSALGQGAQFFNQPLQSAIGNRLALLNAGTQQQQFGLERQLQTGGTTTNQSGTNQGMSNMNQSGASLGSRLSNLGGVLSSAGNTFGTMNFGGPTSLGGPNTYGQTNGVFGQTTAPSSGGGRQVQF